MRKTIFVLAVMIMLALITGCATKEFVSSQTAPLDERISKIERAPAAAAPDQDVAVRAEAAAKKAEAAAQRAEDAAKRVEDAAKRIEEATKKAETAAKKSSKAFELMQKK